MLFACLIVALLEGPPVWFSDAQLEMIFIAATALAPPLRGTRVTKQTARARPAKGLRSRKAAQRAFCRAGTPFDFARYVTNLTGNSGRRLRAKVAGVSILYASPGGTCERSVKSGQNGVFDSLIYEGKYMRAVCIAMCGLLSLPLSATAAELSIAVPPGGSSDPFVQSLMRSKDLWNAGVAIRVVEQTEPADSAKMVLQGKTPFALITLDSLAALKLADYPQLTSIFTQPFLFDVSSDVFTVEAAPLGSAILNDMARTGLTPLGFWNRGTVQLVSKQPVTKIADFKTLIFATAKSDSTTEELKKFGAFPKVLNLSMIPSGFRTGEVNAAVIHAPSAGFFGEIGPAYTTTLRPLVGFLVTTRSVWSNLSEAEKRAWRRATDDAVSAANSAIIKEDKDRNVTRAKLEKVELLRAFGEDAIFYEQAINEVRR
jgi:TRAP-type C4-dicarboxylate transport system substrate-binding protein